jgi:hypothetical protein
MVVDAFKAMAANVARSLGEVLARFGRARFD